jgi:CRISPR-associated protein Cas5d
MKPYAVQLEISGPTALWTRPDTGSSPVSYVAPTFSAVKGIFESILRWKSVNVVPTRCELCAPVQFHRYATNYGGPLRAGDLVAKGARGPSFQLFAVVLVNVCYRLYAEMREVSRAPEGTFSPHAYQDAFRRRLETGQWFYQPCLGWKEFVPDYVGPFRPETNLCETESHELPTMLHMVFDQAQNGRVKPTFSRNLSVEKGVLLYA